MASLEEIADYDRAVESDKRRAALKAFKDAPDECAVCKRPAKEGQTLPICGGCRAVRYCSKECQTTDRSRHRALCGLPNHESQMNAIEYYATVAHTHEGARQLAKRLNFVLPTQVVGSGSLLTVMRRLVVTGCDTEPNLQLLFGPTWSGIPAKVQKEARMMLLLDPPRGCPAYRLNAPLDEGAPDVSARPATEAEQEEVKNVHATQAKIRLRIGNNRAPSQGELPGILNVKGTYPDDLLPVYQLAVNTMIRSTGYQSIQRTSNGWKILQDTVEVFPEGYGMHVFSKK